MFIYEDGLPVDYVPSHPLPPAVETAVREHMLKWYRSLPGQARQRVGKRDVIMYGAEINLVRLVNE